MELNNKASYVLRSVYCSCQYNILNNIIALLLEYSCMLGEQDVSIQTATGFYGDSTPVCAYVHICVLLEITIDE